MKFRLFLPVLYAYTIVDSEDAIIKSPIVIDNLRVDNAHRKYTVERYDRASPYSYDKTLHFLEAEKQYTITTNKAVLPADDAFQVILTCTAPTTAATCLKVENAIKSASKMLVDNLLISKQIVLRATYKTFCAGQPLETCPNRFLVIMNNLVG